MLLNGICGMTAATVNYAIGCITILLWCQSYTPVIWEVCNRQSVWYKISWEWCLLTFSVLFL